ncbi:MAG: 3-methyl-2-oxobutanoate hydroxymethyltransferase [Cyanobacteria bacterium P01_G01_bin.38]
MAITISRFARWKQEGRKVVMLTAWDYMTAQLVDSAGVDIILVGDSLAMPVLGYDTTVPVTLDEMLHHARAVRRGVKNALVVFDLPFLSYQASTAEAIQSAGRALKEAGAQAVKLEGGYEAITTTVRALTQAGIPVMGHVGMTPQSVNQFGGFRKQGKTPESSDRIFKEAIALEKSGAFAIVLEHIPPELAKEISEALTIPTIGIGAGPDCDGQVLVTSDLWGLSEWQPPFAKVYVDLRSQAIEAAQQFCEEVRASDC